MIISKQHHCTCLLLLPHILLLLFHSFNGVLGTQPTSRAPTLIHHNSLHHQKDYHDRFLRRRRQAAPSSSTATCPLDRTLISPCTCSNNKTSKNGLPEISCINFDGSSGQIPLDRIFRNLSNYLAANGQQAEFERLLLVNSQTNSINETLFHGLEFRYLSVYETNLTDIGPASFYDMEDTMQYLLIKGDRLQNVFPSLPRLKLLTTLILNLGTSSFERIPRNALVNMPALQRVTMNGVVNVIERNAFVNLTALQLIKVTNQLERIESDAFVIEYAEEGAEAYSPAPNGSLTTTEAYNDPWSMPRSADPNQSSDNQVNRNGSSSGSEENNNNNDNNEDSSRNRNFGQNIWADREADTSSSSSTEASSTTEGRRVYPYSGDVRRNEDENNNGNTGGDQRNNGDNSRGGDMRERNNKNNGNSFGTSEESSETNRNSNNNANSPNSMQESNNGRFSSRESNGGGGPEPSPGGGRNNLPGGPSGPSGGGIPGGGPGMPGGRGEDIPSVGQDTFSSTESPGNSTSNSTESPISHEVTIDLSNNKLDENSFGAGFIRLVPSLSINLDLTYNWIRYLPEDIFRPFFEVNTANTLQLMNNKFECGRCDSYWIIRNSSLTRDRINVNCYMNSQNSVWNYDWSHCNNDTDNNGGNVTSTPGGNGSANIHQQLWWLMAVVVVVIQLLACTISLF